MHDIWLYTHEHRRQPGQRAQVPPRADAPFHLNGMSFHASVVAESIEVLTRRGNDMHVITVVVEKRDVSG